MTQDETGTTDKEQISGVSQGKGGEEYAQQTEAGQHEEGEESGAGRPTATADARRSTGVNPGGADNIDESMPGMPPA